MISPVSFTSTYKVNNQNPRSFSRFRNFACCRELMDGVKTSRKEKVTRKEGCEDYECESEQTLIVPDYMDYSVELYCFDNGISYTKYDTKDLLNPKSVISRIACAPDGYKKVNIDAEKLEKLAKNQDNNLEHCEKDYNRYYSDKVDTMLKSGEEIPAATLYIHNPSGNDDLKRYVNRFGVDNLNDEQILVYFSQRTDKPDHCIYFALKDLGIDKVPIYVNSESYEAGRILGLF